MIESYKELPESVHTYAHMLSPDQLSYAGSPRVLKHIHPITEGALVVISTRTGEPGGLRRIYSVHLCTDTGSIYNAANRTFRTPKGAHDRCRIERWRWNRDRYEQLSTA